jgi:hypothetical protein
MTELGYRPGFGEAGKRENDYLVRSLIVLPWIINLNLIVNLNNIV